MVNDVSTKSNKQKYVHPNEYLPAFIQGSTVSASTSPGGLVAVKGIFIRLASPETTRDTDSCDIFAVVERFRYCRREICRFLSVKDV